MTQRSRDLINETSNIFNKMRNKETVRGTQPTRNCHVSKQNLMGMKSVEIRRKRPSILSISTSLIV